MNIIIDLNGYTNAITLADAKASGKCNFVFKMMFFNGFLKELNNFGRTLQVA